MRRLLTTSTALSVALATIQPFPLFAQTQAEDGSIIGPDGSVLCQASEGAGCDLNAYLQAAAEKAAAEQAAAQAAADQAAAEQAAAAQAAAEQAAAQAAADQAAAEQAAAAQAAAEQAAAQAAADQAAAEQAAAEQAAAQAAAEQAAAEQAAAQAAADQAAADQAAADKAAADKAAAEQAAADQAAADQAAADKAAADQAAADQAEADAAAAKKAAKKAAADQAAADEAAAAAAAAAIAAQDGTAAPAATEDPQAPAADQAAADKAAADKAAADQAAADKAAADKAAAAQAAADQAAADKAAADQAAKAAGTEAPLVTEPTATEATPVEPATAEPAAATVIADTPVVAPVPTEAAVESLSTLLAPSDPLVPETEPAVAAAAAAVPQGTDAAPAAAAATVTTETVTEQTARSSAEEFTPAPTTFEGDKKKKNRLSDLEKVGLVALGALVVGAVLTNGNRVVQNSGDRVVVQRDDGRYQVYKDDDTLLRRPGSNVRTESYADGSTRTIVEREDGNQIVTIRDATGRVLRRASYDGLGRETIIIDDLVPEERVVIRDLPRPRKQERYISAGDDDAELQVALQGAEAREIGRTFSLRQIREIREVRRLAATIDVDNITFESGSAAIRASEAEKLAKLGRLITDTIAENPGEVFLIEGHTDAVGSASSNLALSDRRAESVALALTEYFEVPPENLVVQGYGESELRVDTNADERRNRRVAVRIITPLLTQASLK